MPADADHLRGNGLTGGIPSELGKLSNLRFLGLEINRLTGELPPSLGDLSNLEDLFLFGNRFTGRIPSEWHKLKKLKRLFLGGSRLTGCTPLDPDDLDDGDLDRLGLPVCPFFELSLTGPPDVEEGETATYTSRSPAGHPRRGHHGELHGDPWHGHGWERLPVGGSFRHGDHPVGRNERDLYPDHHRR